MEGLDELHAQLGMVTIRDVRERRKRPRIVLRGESIVGEAKNRTPPLHNQNIQNMPYDVQGSDSDFDRNVWII